MSALELMGGVLEHIHTLNPHINAIVTLLADESLQAAQAADNQRAKGEDLGLLHGLPIAHKDLVETKGIKTTFGSPIFKDFIPDRNASLLIGSGRRCYHHRQDQHPRIWRWFTNL
ncbi:MAG: amidase family protein [Deinococcales bacterium]